MSGSNAGSGAPPAGSGAPPAGSGAAPPRISGPHTEDPKKTRAWAGNAFAAVPPASLDTSGMTASFSNLSMFVSFPTSEEDAKAASVASPASLEPPPAPPPAPSPAPSAPLPMAPPAPLPMAPSAPLPSPPIELGKSGVREQEPVWGRRRNFVFSSVECASYFAGLAIRPPDEVSALLQAACPRGDETVEDHRRLAYLYRSPAVPADTRLCVVCDLHSRTGAVLEVTERDLTSLQHEQWISSFTLNAFVAVLNTPVAPFAPPRSDIVVPPLATPVLADVGALHPAPTWLWNTKFLQVLAGDDASKCDLAEVRKQFTRISKKGKPRGSWFASDYRVIAAPCNCNKSHWVTIAMDVLHRTVHIYDSLRPNDLVDYLPRQYAEKFAQWYTDQVKGTELALPDGAAFRVQVSMTFPQQTNTVDCGVFTMAALEALAEGKRFSFSQDVVPVLRRRFALRLLDAGGVKSGLE